MKWWLLIVSILCSFPTTRLLAGEPCGDDGTICDEGESCSEHVMAMFSDDHAISPPYVVGKCIPKGQKGSDFWCGNRHCAGGVFMTPSVCCVNSPVSGATPEYSCASSEVSCPGNTQQLSIRESQPTRTLRRG